MRFPRKSGTDRQTNEEKYNNRLFLNIQDDTQRACFVFFIRTVEFESLSPSLENGSLIEMHCAKFSSADETMNGKNEWTYIKLNKI